MNQADQNIQTDYDDIILQIADYVCDTPINSPLAFETARYCLMDTLGCGILALSHPDCVKLLGPLLEGTEFIHGARVPGTKHVLDPLQAAFNLGVMNRWLDFNDTWLAAEWGHPSDNLAGILACADYLSQRTSNKSPITMQTVLEAMIKAHEIQGVLALKNSFNQVGLDHVILVKVATTAVVTQLLGGSKEDVKAAVSQAWLDGHSLRTYRHAPNTGSRKSWAAGDATSRGVRLAMITLQGEMGYPTALTAKTWGFQDVLFNGQALQVERDYASYVMENILFKISFPAEFHAQTAVEAAIQLYPQVKDRIDEIASIELTTQESAVRIISKTGPLTNFADRDHCLQYMVAIGLLFGELKAEHYHDKTASDPRIESLRDKMQVSEDKQFSQDYLDPTKRSIANSLQICFKDASTTEKVVIEYPVGHPRRRVEGIPLLIDKCRHNLSTQFAAEQVERFMAVCLDADQLEKMPVNEFMALLQV